MASSRSPSPGGSPEPLTPRSKIRALLATVESSDEEENGQRDTARTKYTSEQLRSGLASTRREQSRVQSDEEESDDQEVVPQTRPRGKLAARMQGNGNVATTALPETTTKDRIENVRTEPVPDEVSEQRGDVEDEDDEDEDLPTAPRRIKRRVQRQDTPENDNIPTRSPSQGLFVSSPTKPNAESDISGDELPATKSDRFKALVERKRQERLAREAAEEAKKAERRSRLEDATLGLDSEEDNESSITDDEGGRKLTQEARPTRKASRKAIEEMNRETQRMARNMQLAHEAKTRKKITTASLFERFNFKPAGEAPAQQPQPKLASSSSPTTPPPSDDGEPRNAETPPSSPPTSNKANKISEPLPAARRDEKEDEEQELQELPALESVVKSAMEKIDKGKGKDLSVGAVKPIQSAKPSRQVRVRFPVTAVNTVSLDSDEELEVTRTSKDKLNAVFDSIPSRKAKDSSSLQALRALAGVRSPEQDRVKKSKRLGMTATELEVQLNQRVRQQAKMERERRLEMLRAQGVLVQTPEERERQMQEVEDIVAKAREEAQAIMQQEREEVKKERRENGEADPLAWDDSEDEEYQDPGSEADAEAEASTVELSGSEDEGDDEEAEAESEDEEMEGNPLVDQEADEDDGSEEDVVGEEENGNEEEEEEDDDLLIQKLSRKRKQNAVLSDDDDDEAEVKATPRRKMTPGTAPSVESPALPMSVLRSNKKSFIPGLPVQGPAGLGLTQMFAGTMDDSQMSPSAGAPTQSLMPDFEVFPDSNVSGTADEPVDDIVMDSQTTRTQPQESHPVVLAYSQSQMRNLDSLVNDNSNAITATQMSGFEPTQDGGLGQYTPLKERFVEPPESTVDTLPATQADEATQDSPLVRRGRLYRRMETLEEEEPQPSQTTANSAFGVLQKGARKEHKRKLLEEFNKKQSKAKEMVEDQAEESEDEYAGIGGADGEDSDNESAASMAEMIDDAAGNDVDERKLAAFYADRERASDEKEVEKLFKDITSGMLRRKRGADYDLSDEDDGGEARRKMKRRQFAKMQKALFADERVKKMAENPGNQAFLRTMEDQDEDGDGDSDMGFLNGIEPPAEGDESQSQSQSHSPGLDERNGIVPNSQPAQGRLSHSSNSSGGTLGNRLPAHLRRTRDGRKPSNIGEVRETLSDLLDEPQGSVIPATEAGSDSEGEGHDEQEESSNRLSQPPNKENQNPRRSAIVDRISLKRTSSSSSLSSSRLAFAASGSSSSFKVPTLLRRATSNSFASASTSTSAGMAMSTASGVSTSAAGSSSFGEEGARSRKKATGKTTGVNAFAGSSRNEAGVEAKVMESERRRKEKRVKGAERRMGVVGGLLGRGSFE